MNERSINGVRVARPTAMDIASLKVGDWAPNEVGGWGKVNRITCRGYQLDRAFVAYWVDGANTPTVLREDEVTFTLDEMGLVTRRFQTWDNAIWGEMDEELLEAVADMLIRDLDREDLGRLNGEELPGGGPLRDRIEQICRDALPDGEVIDVGAVVDRASQSDQAYQAAEEYWPVWPRRRAGMPFYREEV